MIKSASGTLYLRMNVRKPLKCSSIHFDSCREFASGGRTPDHDDAGVTHHQKL